MDKIDPALLTLAVPIDQVRPHPRNVHTGDTLVIADSLERYGQYKPIIVQKSTGLICAGNHTWKAAKNHLKWDDIAALMLDLDDETALRVLLMDNRSAALGTDDQQALADMLQELGELEGTGYTPEDLTKLLEDLASGDTMPEPGDAEVDHLDQAWGVIVSCGSEGEQLALLDRFAEEGLNVRALMS